MQPGIAADMRNLAVRCHQFGRRSAEPQTRERLAAIAAGLAGKAETLQATFDLRER